MPDLGGSMWILTAFITIYNEYGCMTLMMRCALLSKNLTLVF